MSTDTSLFLRQLTLLFAQKERRFCFCEFASTKSVDLVIQLVEKRDFQKHRAEISIEIIFEGSENAKSWRTCLEN